jgi:hypothetical protein
MNSYMDCLTITNREHNFSDLFQSYLKESTSVKSGVSSSSYCYYGTSYTVYFYEWSDIASRPRQFSSAAIFKKYLDDSNIEYSDYQLGRIHTSKWLYGSCIPGKNELILCDSYMQLRERLLNR